MFIVKQCAMLLFTLCCLTISPAFAQDAAKGRSWDDLVKARSVAFARLKEIQEEFQKTPADKRDPLVEEYSEIATNLRANVLPELIELVPAQLEKNPKDETTLEVANEAMQYSFSRNDYPETKRLAQAVSKADPENAPAANFLGISAFADHDFDEAIRIFDLAEKNGQLIPQLGGRYVDTAKSYVEYWKTEQALREKEDAATGEEQLPRVKLETSRGDIVLELFENEAPNTVANFVNLVEKGFYNGLKFHRVLPTFMAQGGCPFSKTDPQRAGQGGPGYNIKCEAYQPNARRHFAGSLSMAHAGRDTGGSQFFITHLPTPHLDREINPQSVHTVFGRVVEGLDVARELEQNDLIKTATVTRKRSHEYVPETQPE